MTSVPGAMVVIDQKREVIAIREAIKLHIPVIALIDTDSDPDLVDIPIPGNDDAMKAISLIIETLVEATQAGLSGRALKTDKADDEPQRRSRRATTARANDAEAEAEAATVPATPAAEQVATPEPTPETPAEPESEPVVEIVTDLVDAAEVTEVTDPADTTEQA